MLQVMLCAICMMSAALLYYDFVIIPRQNRELVEDLKSHFPEVFPPGGGSPTQKEEQAGREPEVSAVDLRFLQSQYPDVRGWLTIPESGIDYPVLQSSPEEPEYYLRRDYQGNYDINGSLFLQADCILGESGNLTIYGHNMNSGAMFGNLDQYSSYEYWKAHPRVFFQTPEGMEEYRIAAVLKADVSMFDFQRTSFQSPQELEAYVQQAKEVALFETGVDGMLEVNHKQSVEKIQRAKLAIQEMIEEEDKVTVPKLMQKTGLSRGFFYKNPEVRKAVDRALQLQAGMVDKRRKILDMAMDNRILQLEQQVAKLKRENETLRKENEAMRKALNKRDLNLIKNF